MVGKLVFQGLIVGILAGLLGFGFARLFGEPAMDVSVHFESQQDEARAAAARAAGKPVPPEAPEVFSRAVQRGIGLLTAVVAVGAGLGALFAVLFAFANGRIGTLGPGATALLLALLGWLSVFLVPALKYPPNPPGASEADTIRIRTAVYFLLMAISIATTVGAWMLGSAVARARGAWNGFLAGVLAYLLVLALAFAILPPINEVPANFPAVTLWEFRIASIGLEAVLWGGVGLIFGTLAEWSQAAQRARGVSLEAR